MVTINFKYNQQLRYKLINLNVEGIETLVRLCSSDNSKVREYSCLALSNLTFKNMNNCRCILNYQGVEVLVNLMKDEKDTTKAYACMCLTNMAIDSVIRDEVAHFSFGQSVSTALSSSNTFTQAKSCLTVAAYCMDNYIKNEVNKISTIINVQLLNIF
jgi:hypothetical protein